jgi:hypothetical protein
MIDKLDFTFKVKRYFRIHKKKDCPLVFTWYISEFNQFQRFLNTKCYFHIPSLDFKKLIEHKIKKHNLKNNVILKQHL